MNKAATASLAHEEFRIIRQFIYNKASIVIADDQHYLVESRLAPVMEQEGMLSFQLLVEQLQQPAAQRLHERVVCAITTNESYFFRDVRPFTVLRESILPKLIESRRNVRRLEFLFAGCSSGQEPYSVAMLLRHYFPELENWDLRLTAVDISGDMIRRSREGFYSQFEVNRGLPAALLVRYFEKVGVQWRIHESIRNMVNFQEMNLTQNFPELSGIDVVFMRNVLIYFDEETRRSLLQRVERLLEPDGCLIMGAAEAPIFYSKAFEPIALENSYIFQLKK